MSSPGEDRDTGDAGGDWDARDSDADVGDDDDGEGGLGEKCFGGNGGGGVGAGLDEEGLADGGWDGGEAGSLLPPACITIQTNGERN